jgi:hypothetical protein
MSTILTLFRELFKPDGQDKDWYTWATNQLSHALLGVVFGGVALLSGLDPLGVLLLGATIVVVKEGSDLFRGASVWDSVNDVLFQVLGGLFVGGLMLKLLIMVAGSLAVGLFLLFVGASKRLRSHDDAHS